MKRKYISLLFLFVFTALFVSCEDYVSNVDPLVDAVEDEVLTNESEVQFLIIGIQNEFALATDDLFIAADGLSDQLFFTRNVPNATYPTYEQIDIGEILLDNNSIDNAFDPLQRFRKYADTLIARLDKITFQDTDLQKEGYFNAYLYGAIARYYLATYFGLTETQGGGVINVGPFIPSNQMYDLAIERFKTALTYAPGDYETRLVNSLIARCYLFKGDYVNAATYAQQGLLKGDAPLEAKYSTLSDNNYRVQAGELRSQFVVDFRFNQYINQDPTEAGRIQLKTRKGGDGVIYYYQYKYKLDATGLVSSIPIMTWQENNLMKAELILRGAMSGDAVALVNEVRESHSVSTISTISLDTTSPSIVEERDKELFCQGMRLPDQRRFNIFHMPGKWQYLPITQNERVRNPNLQ
ncbi:hypothetical protein [Melioribacter sp. OK-6-Me]|uniref:hypothetical protein n=1 Tax=unclassified Melioribacter TaxID=2627329 RepID=UPI003ED9D5FC